MLFYWSLCLSPIILDVIDPLNETRTKICIFHTDSGIDKHKYYWFVLAHEFLVTMVALAVLIAVETAYFTFAVHVCALFEVVGCVLSPFGKIDCTKQVTSLSPHVLRPSRKEPLDYIVNICDEQPPGPTLLEILEHFKL